MAAHGDREAFLSRLRAQLAAGVPVNPLRPVEPGGRAPAPVRYAADLDDPVAAFAAAARAAGAEVHDDADRDAVVREVCERWAVRRAVVSRDPECAGLAGVLAGAGVTVAPPDDIGAVAAADLGVTGAARGIALTGSLVVDSGRAGGRTASLLPPVHLGLLRRDAIVPTPGDLWRHLDEHLPGGLPANLVTITGPSRSADIELVLTLGVHGPRELVIVLV